MHEKTPDPFSVTLLLATLSPLAPTLVDSWISLGGLFTAFAFSSLLTFGLGKWLAAPALRSIRRQVNELGRLRDNQSSLLSNFGANLYVAALVGVIIGGQYLCDWTALDHAHADIAKLLSCYRVTVSTVSALAGLGTGYLLWLFVSVVRMERALNQKVVLERYTTRNWSAWFVVGVAIVIFIIIRAFYQVFKLG